MLFKKFKICIFYIILYASMEVYHMPKNIPPFAILANLAETPWNLARIARFATFANSYFSIRAVLYRLV